MISKSTIKLINSLALSKFRRKENAFVAEGDKTILELLSSSYTIRSLYATKTFIDANSALLKDIPVELTDHSYLKKASLLQSPQNSLAVCEIPAPQPIRPEPGELSLYLDGIQDPGNLGTIIRLCDWFGIQKIFCSPSTVDMYNPKVIQATMGAFTRIKLCKIDFHELFKQAREVGLPVYGTFMDGRNIYEQKLPTGAILVFGNEGKGISEELQKIIDNKLTIPQLNAAQQAESLNVSVAAAIIVSEFKRCSVL